MKILFHYPFPLIYPIDGSSVRPLKMLEAFKELGYTVDIVCGYRKERSRAISEIKNKISHGVQYDFLYTESSTMPTLLTEKHHLPLAPFLDFNFFSFLKKKGVPIGLFYRDIYWIFPPYSQLVGKIKALISKQFYLYDLKQYEKYLDQLYIPSFEMKKYIPINKKILTSALPPGHSVEQQEIKNINKKINLLYIGGFSDHYQMHELFYALKKLPSVQLILCTRQAEWESQKQTYPSIPNIKIVHSFGKELENLYRMSDIAMLFFPPQEYRNFAAPVKLYEYLGHLKPIIASSGTLAGNFVASNNIGWEIPYHHEHLINLIHTIQKKPSIIKEKISYCKIISQNHTWKARAQQVACDLTRK